MSAEPPVHNEISPFSFGCTTAVAVTMLFLMGSLLVAGALTDTPALLPALGATQLGLMLLPTLFLSQFQSLSPRELFRLNPVPVSVHLMLLLGIVTLWPVLQWYLIAQDLYLVPPSLRELYTSLEQASNDAYAELFSSRDVVSFVMSLAVIALIPGICEEMLFRGAVQRSFERRVPPSTAIAAAGLMFGLIHVQPITFVPLTALGLFFGYVVWASESIYPAILGHFIFNAVTIAAVFATVDAFDLGASKRHTTGDLVELLPIAGACLAVFILVLLWFRRHRRAIEREWEEADAAEQVTQSNPDDQQRID